VRCRGKSVSVTLPLLREGGKDMQQKPPANYVQDKCLREFYKWEE